MAAAAAAAVLLLASRHCGVVYFLSQLPLRGSSCDGRFQQTYHSFLYVLQCVCFQVDFVGYIPNPHYSRAKAAGCLTSLTWLLLLLCCWPLDTVKGLVCHWLTL
jgi:hypothetical protein